MNTYSEIMQDTLHVSKMVNPMEPVNAGYEDSTATIFEQLGGPQMADIAEEKGAYKPFYTVAGAYNCGALFIKFDPASVKDGAFGLVISNRYNEDYTLTYFKKVHDGFEIIKEYDQIYCDQLTGFFTTLTGIEIPEADFGPIIQIISFGE